MNRTFPWPVAAAIVDRFLWRARIFTTGLCAVVHCICVGSRDLPGSFRTT